MTPNEDHVPILPALTNALDELRAAYNDSAFVVHMDTILVASAALDALRALPDVRTRFTASSTYFLAATEHWQRGQDDLARALRAKLEGGT